MTKKSRKSNEKRGKNLKKRTALSKMNRELLEVHVLGVRNAIRLEHKQHQQTNERMNERTNDRTSSQIITLLNNERIDAHS